MPFYSYPSAADIEALMKSAAYWPTDAVKQEFAALQAEIAAQAAADEWENLVGWYPFLSSGIVEARTFREIDSRGFVDFKAGAHGIVSVTQNGNALVSGSSYLEYPENAAPRRQAVTGIEIGPRFGAAYYLDYIAQNPIVVTAKWGKVCTVPGDVWQAIQQKAALIVLTQIENLQSVASISQDGFTKAYDTVGILTQKDMVTLWGKDFVTLAMRHQRVVS